MNSNTPINAPRPLRTALPLWGMAALVLGTAPCRPALADQTPIAPVPAAAYVAPSTPAADPNGRLLQAVLDGDAAATRAALAAGADANATFHGGTYDGASALLVAAGKSRTEVVGALLERRADVNCRGPHGTTPLMAAVVSGGSIPAAMHTIAEAMQARQREAALRGRGLGGLFGGGGLGGMLLQGALMFATGGAGGMLTQGLAGHAAQALTGQAVQNMAGQTLARQVEGQAVQAVAGRLGGGTAAGLAGAALSGGTGTQALSGRLGGALAGGDLRAAFVQARQEQAGADAAGTHDAATPGNPELVRLLVAHGADVNAKDDQGCTVLDLAHAVDRLDVADILKEKGAQESDRGRLFDRALPQSLDRARGGRAFRAHPQTDQGGGRVRCAAASALGIAEDGGSGRTPAEARKEWGQGEKGAGNKKAGARWLSLRGRGVLSA